MNIKHIWAVIIMVSMIGAASIIQAAAGDARAVNIWYTQPPTAAIANVASLVRTEKIDRRKPAYFSVANIGGTLNVVQLDASGDPQLVSCTAGHATDGCDSAPIYIASPTATLCIDSDITGTGTSSAVISAKICPSKDNCTDVMSWEQPNTASYQALRAADAYACSEYGVGVVGINGFQVGGQWVYLKVVTGPTSAGEHVAAWVVGTD